MKQCAIAMLTAAMLGILSCAPKQPTQAPDWTQYLDLAANPAENVITYGCEVIVTGDKDAQIIVAANPDGRAELILGRSAATNAGYCDVETRAGSIQCTFGEDSLPVGKWAQMFCKVGQKVGPGMNGQSMPACLDPPKLHDVIELPDEIAQGCFLFNGALSDRDQCRVCSCGWLGDKCTCASSGINGYENTGRNEQLCSSCELPNCAQEKPEGEH